MKDVLVVVYTQANLYDERNRNDSAVASGDHSHAFEW
jgi:hypothetical protein